MSYKNTFIVISDDCAAKTGIDPSSGRGRRTRAEIEYHLITSAPYTLDHDSLNYEVYRIQKSESCEQVCSRDEYLSRGRPCLRASSLVKRFGFGAHYDASGRIAIYPVESAEYARFANPAAGMKVIKGMRSSRNRQ